MHVTGPGKAAAPGKPHQPLEYLSPCCPASAPAPPWSWLSLYTLDTIQKFLYCDVLIDWQCS